MSWLELFFDLVFVTAFDRLAQRLGAHLGLPSFGVFALMFMALWWAWLGNTSFAARYGNTCRAYRWGTLTQMLALAALAVSVRGDLNDVGTFFALAYAAGRAVLIVMLLLNGRQDGRLAPGDTVLVRGFAVGVALWLISAFLTGPAQLGLWALALLTDLSSTLYSEKRYSRELPHQAHFPERVGLLFIVFLGAVVTELIRGAAEQRLLVADQLPAALALMTVMAVWRLYFDEAHALPALLAGRSGRAGTLLAWTYTHLPLTLALSVLSVGLGLGVAEEGQAADRHERLLVGASLAAVFTSLALLRALSANPLKAGITLGTPAELESGKPDRALPAVVRKSGLPRQNPLLSLSALARLAGAALLLLLIAAPIGTLVYQAICTVVTLAVAYLSWRDPLREQLVWIEDELIDETEKEAATDATDEKATDSRRASPDPDRAGADGAGADGAGTDDAGPDSPGPDRRLNPE